MQYFVSLIGCMSIQMCPEAVYSVCIYTVGTETRLKKKRKKNKDDLAEYWMISYT